MRSLQARRIAAHAASRRRLLSSSSSSSSSAPTAASTGGAASSSSTPSSSAAVVPSPITSLLIANRGEIALRIALTAARLGIRATTVYTRPDAASQHASTPLATGGSLSLGPAASGYLDGPLLVSLAARRGITALHPGYGFLSENAAFATMCAEAGIEFVGPPPQAMRDMGDKARSKEVMTAAGVPCVPGYHGAEQGEAELARRARDDVGYPVLLKSVKGGGGKGMRIVRTPAEFAAQLRSARQEARASFGEGGEVMLVERYITRPRHVEVQVFADKHGNCVALGERDCSVQRRHQKIVEESPAPGLDEATRQLLWERARAASLAVGYVGAGTVEFILDRDTGDFFFMEMNTRLQVEHPVTEMVTGADLVEWQLRVAGGEPLPWTQQEVEARIRARGHAVEARIYAESPERGFVPDSGRLVHLRLPPRSSTGPSVDDGVMAGDRDVRVDAGFAEGDVVSEAYDGMLAKLIVRGPDRETAIRRLDLALQRYEVAGPSTNIEFVKRLCRNDAFVRGDVDTGFIDRWRDDLFRPARVDGEVFVQAAVGLLANASLQQRLELRGGDAAGPHGDALGFADAPAAFARRRFAFRLRGGPPEDECRTTVAVELTPQGGGLYSARVTRGGAGADAAAKRAEEEDSEEFENVVATPVVESASRTTITSYFPLSRVSTTLITDGEPGGATRLTVFQGGAKTELELAPPPWFEKALGLSEAAGGSVAAPMPCKILRNEVAEGQAVEKGDPLVVIESMKMETVIRSPQKGVVKKLAHREGDICKAGTVLVIFEEEVESKA